MNVEKIHSFFLKIEEEFEKKKFTAEITKLQTALTQIATTPPTTTVEEFRSQRTKTEELLTGSSLNDLPNSENELAALLSIRKYFGNALNERIKAIIYENNSLPTTAAQELGNLNKEVEKFSRTISSTIKNFEILNIPVDIEISEFVEIGLIIPREVTTDSLVGFEAEIHQINIQFKNISEIAGEEFDVKVKAVSSTDLYLQLLVYGGLAKLFLHLVDKALDICLKFKQVRQEEDKFLENYPENFRKAALEHTNNKLKEEIQAVADDVKKNHQVLKADAKGRDEEINNAVTVFIRYLIDRIGKGTLIEVRVNVEEPKAGEDQEPVEGVGADATTGVNPERAVLFKELKEKAVALDARLRSGGQLKSEKPLLLLDFDKDTAGDKK